MKKAYLVVDCGTTNLRVTLLDEQKHVLGTVRANGGVKHTAIDGNDLRLRAMLRDSIKEVLSMNGYDEKQVVCAVAYGMITSNMGLVEIPHVAAPASLEAMRAAVKEIVFQDIASFPIRFIPGVRNFREAVGMENFSDMDMMRGEETEAIGLFGLLEPDRDCVFVLPGSHNKFVMMDRAGSIRGCMTSVSGELLDVITHGTILTDSVGGEFADTRSYDRDMVTAGALECDKSGIGRAAFAGRILQTLGGVEREKIRSYLLGATLAPDVSALRTFIGAHSGMRIYVAGKAPVQDAVCDVMNALGKWDIVPVEAAVSGIMGTAGAIAIGLE